MQRKDIARLYDANYAASYEEKFLLSNLTKSDSDYEVELLRGFLASGATWLDVACGTGYFLKQFPDVERAGIDLSPAMIERARKANPGVPITENDFRDPIPAWNNRWGLVSCMWYAYGLVDTVTEVEMVIHNLWSLTSADGTCFVPILDTRLITGVPLPFRKPYDETSHVEITGIV